MGFQTLAFTVLLRPLRLGEEAVEIAAACLNEFAVQNKRVKVCYLDPVERERKNSAVGVGEHRVSQLNGGRPAMLWSKSKKLAEGTLKERRQVQVKRIIFG